MRYGKWLAVSLGLMLAVMTAMTEFSDPAKVGAVLKSLGWRNFLVIVGFSTASLLLRNLRWRILLEAVGKRLGLVDLFPIFVAGQAASLITPGKSGDLLRAHALKKRVGLKRRKGMATVFVERFVDFGLILLFAIYGFLSFGAYSVVPVMVVAGGMLVVAGAMVNTKFARMLSLPLFTLFRRFERLSRAEPVIREAYGSIRSIGKKPQFFFSALLGVAVWTVEFLRMHFTIVALGGSIGQVQVAFAASVSLLVAMATMLPGGVGGYEASYITVLTSIGVALPVVAGALIMERVVGYGFTLIVGLISMKWVEV